MVNQPLLLAIAAASMFCQYRERMAIASAGLAVLWLVIKFASTVSN